MMPLMPELPEVEAVRRRLEPAMRGARIAHVLLRRKNLRQPFPPAFASRLEGRRIRSVDRRGKYLLAELDSGDTLLMHLGMSGSFRIDRDAKRRTSMVEAAVEAPGDRHDHVVLTLSNGLTVTFNDPRRFGVMDLLGAGPAASHRALAAMGPEPLGAAFSAAALASALTGKRVALKVALLDQRVVAGLGNIYASEALHRAGLSPLRRSSTLATAAGTPGAKRRPPGGGDQDRSATGDRPQGTSVSRQSLPRLRARGRAVQNARLPRNDPPHLAGRPIDVLLSGVPALIAVPRELILAGAEAEAEECVDTTYRHGRTRPCQPATGQT